MIVKKILSIAQEKLSQHNIENPSLEAKVLLAYLLQCRKEFLWAYPEKVLSIQQEKDFFHLIARRASGEPIAYITSDKEFWSLNLKVTTDTLIPRPDTELLVEIILHKYANQTTPDINVLELGVGSGAISLALASERPGWKITAVDFSKAVLAIAKYNAQRNDISNIDFIHSNWFEHVSRQEKFNIIVSNPPYIAENDPHLSQGDLRFEPESALVSGADGLDDMRKIITQAKHFLTPNGLLILEHGYQQAEKIRALFFENNYRGIQTCQDLSGLDRVSLGIS